jgi:hypothetical protein
MNDQLTEVSALLLKQYVFQGLNEEQIKSIASRFRLVRYQAQQTVIYEDMPGIKFFIVYKGQVEVSALVKKLFKAQEKVKLYTYGPGEFFGAEAIIYKSKNRDVVKTNEESVLLVIDNVKFLEMLEEFPEVAEKFKLIVESRRFARKKQFPWLIAGESIQLMGRKHTYFLIRSLLLPIFLFLLSIPAIVYTFTILEPSSLAIFFRIGSLLLMLGAFFGFIWNWIDWGNDYYIVTTQRILWLEKVVGLYESRNEAPLYTILTVDVKSSQAGRILNYGNVATRTYTGIINMDRVNRPKELASFIEGHIKRMLLLSEDDKLGQFESDLKKALHKPDPTSPDLEELVIKKPDAKSKTKEGKSRSLRERMKYLLNVRFEQEGVIIYRKHWFLLVRRIWIAVAGLVIWFLLLSLVVSQKSNPTFSSLVGTPLYLISFFIFIGVFAWLIYSYEDWRNDIYKLTPEQIFQIYRKPLGSELKTSANIENILTIEHERENITGIMLNFGNVIVSVGDTKIIFEGVKNPDQVHQDIADYQEALKRRKRDQNETRNRKRMVKWLMAYHQETQNPINEEIPPNGEEVSG